MAESGSGVPKGSCSLVKGSLGLEAVEEDSMLPPRRRPFSLLSPRIPRVLGNVTPLTLRCRTEKQLPGVWAGPGSVALPMVLGVLGVAAVSWVLAVSLDLW